VWVRFDHPSTAARRAMSSPADGDTADDVPPLLRSSIHYTFNVVRSQSTQVK
jgi:hypothetical protein